MARRGATLLGEHPELSTCCSTVGSPTCPWPRPCPGSCSRRWAKVRGQCEREGTQGGGREEGGGGAPNTKMEVPTRVAAWRKTDPGASPVVLGLDQNV